LLIIITIIILSFEEFLGVEIGQLGAAAVKSGEGENP
jgi:hypothetical protein